MTSYEFENKLRNISSPLSPCGNIVRHVYAAKERMSKFKNVSSNMLAQKRGTLFLRP